MSEKLKDGKDTTEYEVTTKSNFWSVVALIVGSVVTIGATTAEAAGTDSKVGILIGGIVTVAALAHKWLVSVGYIKSRTEVKTKTVTPSEDAKPVEDVKPVKDGKDTTEYEVTKKSNFWSVVAIVVGSVVTVGATVADIAGAGSGVGVAVGGAVVVAGVAQKLLVSAGYVKSRTEVKTKS